MITKTASSTNCIPDNMFCYRAAHARWAMID
jgi:hypothetical protein